MTKHGCLDGPDDPDHEVCRSKESDQMKQNEIDLGSWPLHRSIDELVEDFLLVITPDLFAIIPATRSQPVNSPRLFLGFLSKKLGRLQTQSIIALLKDRVFYLKDKYLYKKIKAKIIKEQNKKETQEFKEKWLSQTKSKWWIAQPSWHCCCASGWCWCHRPYTFQ